MTTWLKLLPLELQGVTNFMEPQQEVKQNDNIVGVMSDDLKKLYTLWMMFAKESEQAKLDYRFSNSPESGRKSVEYKFKAEALQCIFWTCINDEFNLWNKYETGVRNGWQVCWSDESSDKSHLPDFFRRLLEG